MADGCSLLCSNQDQKRKFENFNINVDFLLACTNLFDNIGIFLELQTILVAKELQKYSVDIEEL